MPKVKMASGKVKKFPYTKSGVKAAKAASKSPGADLEVNHKYEMMYKSKKPNTHGMKYLKG